MSEIKLSPVFERSLKEVLKKYSKESDAINKFITEIASNPHIGDVYEGYGNIGLRKARIPLKSYNIGKSKGLRIIYIEKDEAVEPIHIYCKSDFARESKIRSCIMSKIKEIKEILRNSSQTD